jgi:beta-fructofuranosidase
VHINYKPVDGWAADFIPFYWQGEYHLFYLKDFRDIPKHGEGTPWCHLVTRDFVNFVDHGECLKRGTIDDQDLYVFTGSVIQGEGRFHIFYTGHNPHLRKAGKSEQAIMHAVSDDLYEWKKCPEDTFFAPSDRFEPHDWRDPFVFWNEEAAEYWMVTAARLKEGPSRRRGCTGLCTSKDLVTWAVKEPFYAPDMYFTHECPDVFRMGHWWYLLFSEFSDACVTRYRMARSANGPWITPEVDTFDGRAFYAAKTAEGDNHRYLFGWNPTQTDAKDYSTWDWGSNLVVHEVVQRPDGTLGVRIPESVRNYFVEQMPVHFGQTFKTPLPKNGTVRLEGPGSFRCISAGKLPEMAKIEATVVFTEPTKGFGIMLRTSMDFETGYYIRVEPQRNRLVFDSWPRRGDIPFMVEIERPIKLEPKRPVQMIIYVDSTLCEVYLDNQVAMSARMYNHPEGDWGLFVSEGNVEFREVSLSTPNVPK